MSSQENLLTRQLGHDFIHALLHKLENWDHEVKSPLEVEENYSELTKQYGFSFLPGKELQNISTLLTLSSIETLRRNNSNGDDEKYVALEAIKNDLMKQFAAKCETEVSEDYSNLYSLLHAYLQEQVQHYQVSELQQWRSWGENQLQWGLSEINKRLDPYKPQLREAQQKTIGFFSQTGQTLYSLGEQGVASINQKIDEWDAELTKFGELPSDDEEKQECVEEEHKSPSASPTR